MAQPAHQQPPPPAAGAVDKLLIVLDFPRKSARGT